MKGSEDLIYGDTCWAIKVSPPKNLLQPTTYCYSFSSTLPPPFPNVGVLDYAEREAMFFWILRGL